jgi:FAD-dependent urate hydroxylase
VTVVVLGAGPMGLGVAAHLRAEHVPHTIFGRTLGFWREHMPHDMLLRSRARSSSIAEPSRRLRIEDWAAAVGRPLSLPIMIGEFIAYGDWFQERAVPEVDARFAQRVEALDGRGFGVTLDDGSTLEAHRVVVGAGLEPFARRPAPFDRLAASRCSHTADHTSFERFAGASVVVVGSGQSALETAALLAEAGARTEVIARSARIVWLGDVRIPRPPTLRERILPPTDVGGRVTGWTAAIPDVYRLIPGRYRTLFARRCSPPAGAGWLPERLADVPLTLGREIRDARLEGDGVRLELAGGETRTVDHVVLGTGFEVDVRRYPFLDAAILARLRLELGHPVLGRGLESSVAGLHFVGSPAARSFGPIMRFVVGSWFAAPAVADRIRGRLRPFRRSF